MGNKYVGNYKNDQRHGWGTMQWIDGSCYKGQWADGIQSGFGIMVYASSSHRTKTRMGWFQNNVFLRPLTSITQIQAE